MILVFPLFYQSFRPKTQTMCHDFKLDNKPFLKTTVTFQTIGRSMKTQSTE